jgi:hypothetical protein
VNTAQAVNPPRAALPLAQRAVVAALARLLPAGFRDRQHAEWTGDLVALSDTGAGNRWRYLLGAAWTLPSLRAVVVRRGATGGPVLLTGAPAAMATIGRVLLVGLGWPVVSWWLAVFGRYTVLDIPGRLAANGGTPVDPKDLWPVDGPWIVLIPLWVLLSLGAGAAVVGGPYLVSSVGLAGLLAGPAQRRRTGRHRAAAALGGLAVLVAAQFVLSGRGHQDDLGNGIAGAVLGAGAIVLAVAGRGIRGRVRFGLALIGAAAIGILAVDHSAMGPPMLSWFLD